MNSTQWTQPYSYVPDAHPDLIEQLRDRARKQSLFTLWLSEHWLAVVYGIGVGMMSTAGLAFVVGLFL